MEFEQVIADNSIAQKDVSKKINMMLGIEENATEEPVEEPEVTEEAVL